MFWTPPAGTEPWANPPAFLLERARWKTLKDPRAACKDGSPAPSVTHTQARSQPNQAPTCLLCRDDNTVALSTHSPQVTHTVISFICTRTGFFFSLVPGDTDPKHTPLKQSHVSLQNNWHVFLWLGINHTHFSNPRSWQAPAVAI